VGWAEVDRIAGEIALIAGAGRGKSGSVSRAGAYSRASSAGKSWERRAAQWKPQQAREVLAPVYGWFTEGFDTRDLKEAKALLNALSPPPDAPLTSKDAT
jgi:predicted ATPase